MSTTTTLHDHVRADVVAHIDFTETGFPPLTVAHSDPTRPAIQVVVNAATTSGPVGIVYGMYREHELAALIAEVHAFNRAPTIEWERLIGAAARHLLTGASEHRRAAAEMDAQRQQMLSRLTAAAGV